MSVKNSTIMNRVWLTGTNDFQQRIPQPTQGSISATVDALQEPMNGAYYNQFIDALINRVGQTIVNNKRWDNPLAPFKRSNLQWGSTIQEIAPKWIKAHSYCDYDETLLKLNRPEMAQYFHSVNREDRYDISINREELNFAFTDEYGLNNLVDSVMTVPANSDAYDEYRIMLQLIAEYENKWGFYKENLTAAPTTENTSKEFLRKVRTLSGKFQFPSTLYNASNLVDIPVFAKQDELVLITTPEVMAAVSVEALAGMFNVELADINAKVVLVDEFPIADCYALLTTRDFFVVADKVYQTTSFYDPKSLNNHYFLHHWEVCSVSPMVPAVLFTTDDATDIPTATFTAGDSITIGGRDIETGAAFAGDAIPAGTTEFYLDTTLAGAFDASYEGISVRPDSCIVEISLKDAIKNSRTYVEYLDVQTDNVDGDAIAIIHLQKSIESTDEVTVTVKSTYVNPSGDTSIVAGTKTFTFA